MPIPARSTDAAALIDLLITRAPALIAVGVTSLSIGEMSATLQAPAPKPDAPTKPAAIAKQHTDPLRDASTYPGGKVPGFTREDEPR
jgi:hypothetical protein